MRRLPISWTTTLAQLGFRRKRKRHHEHGERSRRARFEPLEARHMLAAYMVNSTADTELADNELTLREAVALANIDTALDTIAFDPLVFDSQKTITLESGQLTINGDLTIEGPGANLLSISGDDTSRVFVVNVDTVVAIQDLTVTHGEVLNGNGGAILSNGNLTLERVVVTDSLATGVSGSNGAGGGVHSAAGSLTLIDSTIENNEGYKGGGVAKIGGGTGQELNIIRSTIAGNEVSTAYGSHAIGGGVHINATGEIDVSIVNSTVSSNTANYGAGLEIRGSSGSATVEIVNSTIAYNSAVGSSGQSGPGGIRVDTITVTLHNSIVAANTSNSGGVRQLSVVNSNSSYNLIGPQNTSPGFTGAGNVLGVSDANAGLAALDYYGGYTKTHALLPASVAINAGDDNEAVSAGLLLDQRGTGYPRILGTHVDVGAHEAWLRELPDGSVEIYGTAGNDAISLSNGGVSHSGLGEIEIDLSGALEVHVFAEEGDDVVTATEDFIANLEVYGGAGNDYLVGGAGADEIDGEAGADMIYGGDGIDALDGGSGNDTLYGEAGEDVLSAGAGDDWLYGGDGNDTLVGDAGNNVLEGGDGDDAYSGAGTNDYVIDILDTGPPADVNLPPVFQWIGSPQQVAEENFTVNAVGGMPLRFEASVMDPEGGLLTFVVRDSNGQQVLNGPEYNASAGYFEWSNPPNPPNGSTDTQTYQIVATDDENNETVREFTIEVSTRNFAPQIIELTFPSPEELEALQIDPDEMGTQPVGDDPIRKTFSHVQYPDLGSGSNFQNRRLFFDEPYHTVYMKVLVSDPNGDVFIANNVSVSQGTKQVLSNGDGTYSIIISHQLDSDTLVLLSGEDMVFGTSPYEVAWDYTEFDDVLALGLPDPVTETFEVTINDDYGGSTSIRLHAEIRVFDNRLEDNYNLWFLREGINGLTSADETIHVPFDTTEVPFQLNVSGGSDDLRDFYFEVLEAPMYGDVYAWHVPSSDWVMLSQTEYFDGEALTTPIYSAFKYVPDDLEFFKQEEDRFAYRYYSVGLGGDPEYRPTRLDSNIAIVTFVPPLLVSAEPEEYPTSDVPPDCDCDCGCGDTASTSENSASGTVRANVSSASGGGGNYANAAPETLLKVDLKVPELANSVTASFANVELYFDELLVNEFSRPIAANQLVGKEEGSVFVPLTSEGLPSGYYQYRVEVGAGTSVLGETKADATDLPWTLVMGQDDIGFGPGWNLAGTERLLINPSNPEMGDIFWLRQDGYNFKFEGVGGRAEGDLSASQLSLLEEDDPTYGALEGDYLLLDKFGNRSYFEGLQNFGQPGLNIAGRLKHRVDAVGNITDYTYTDANGDDFEYEPLAVTNRFDGSKTVFQYASQKVEQIHNVAPNGVDTRITHLEYDELDGYLSKLKLPDPNLANGVETDRGVFEFDQDEYGRLVLIVEPNGLETSYDYDDQNGIITKTHDGHDTVLVLPQLSPYSRRYVAVRPIYEPTVALPVHPTSEILEFDILPTRTGKFIDELGRTSEFEIDAGGYIAKWTDPAGRVTEYDRTVDGLINERTLFDSDGGAILDQTTYTYSTDDKLNLLGVEYFDGSTESWTYDATFGLATSYTDELGRQTLSTVADGRVTSIRQVMGQVDTPQNGEHDDLLTNYEYTTDGLLERMIEVVWDPDTDVTRELVTLYEYTGAPFAGFPDNRTDKSRWLEKVTFAEGSTNDEAEILITDHDAFGNPLTVDDEVGRLIRYFYDDAGRLVRMVQADPDDNGVTNGPLWHPTTEYAYSKASTVVDVTQTSLEDPDAGTLVYGDSIVTHYHYHGHHLESITLDEGGIEATTEYEYDAAHNLTAVIDPLGRRTEYLYDLLDRPIRITEEDPDGAETLLASPVTLLAYDALGRLIAERDPRNSVTRYQYDRRHRVTKILAPLGSTTSLVYDDAGQLEELTDAEGRTTSYVYDDAGRLTELHLPNSNPQSPAPTPITYQYDTASNLRFVTDQLGRETEYQYDDLHRLATEILPAANPALPNQRPTTTYEYFDDGQLATMSEAVEIQDVGGSLTYLNRTTTWEYDDAGRLASVFLPSSATGAATHEWQNAHDEFGNVVKVTDPLGNRTEYQYDDLHRLVKEIGEHPTNNAATGEAGRPVTEYLYDDAGQLLEVTEKLSDSTTRTSSYVYDNLGRLSQSVQPDPLTGDGIYDNGIPDPPGANTPFMDFTYDAAGNLLSAKDKAALGTTFAYDALGRRTSETDANSHATRFTYDRVGNLLSLTDPEDNTTSWQYDSLDRVTRETNALGHARTFAYDIVGNLTKRIDREGRVTRYDYDDAGRVTTESWFADVLDVTPDRELDFTYDLLGRVLASGDPDHDYAYTYDYRNLSSIDQAEITGLTPAIAFQHVYDGVGNLTTVSAFIGSTSDYENGYQYDNLHRLTTLTQQEATTGTPNEVLAKRVDMAYDLAGQFDTITRYASTTTASPVAVTDYDYDFAGRIKEIEHRSGGTAGSGTLLAGYGTTWNERSQLTAIDFLPNGVNSPFNYSNEDVAYNYDNRHQLEGADYTGLTDESYAYDDNGNRTGGGFTVDTNNRIASDGTYDYVYDDEENIVLRTKISDGSYTVYTWDHRNRLVTVTNKTAAQAETSRVEYRYDADDNLIGRRLFMNGSSTATQSSAFVHQNGQMVFEFNGTGNGDLQTADLARRYLWGPVVDQLFADEQLNLYEMDDRVLWALTDHLGTPRDWVDDTGAIFDHALYGAFGRRLDIDPIGATLEWTGHFRDPVTGLQLNGKRWYNPAIGRWMSEDPIKDGTNWGIYVGNAPTMFVDPNGLAEQEPVNAITPGAPIAWQPIESLPLRIQQYLGDPSRFVVKLHQDQGYFILDKQTGATHFVADENALPLRERARRAQEAVECAETQDFLLGAAGNLMTSIPGVETVRDGYEVVTGRDMVDPRVRLSREDRIGTAQMFFVPGLSGSQVRRTDELLEAVRQARGVRIRGSRLGQEQGREFRIDQLELQEFDPNCPAHVRGWLVNERRRIAQGGTPTEPAVPPGYELGHGRTTPAREGYDYSNSQLQGIDLNQLEERIRRRQGRP
ncbi:MAG: RHS repeat-associated core domain-containing protein [Pirellulales bacterium]